MLGSFENALSYAKKGGNISRAGWNGKHLIVRIQHPDPSSKMTLPYLYLEYPDGTKVPWLASQTDLLSDDWDKAFSANYLGPEEESI